MSTEPVEGIAIIGMSGRFPAAGNVQRFWENIRNGVEGITFFEDEELISAGVKKSELSNPGYVRAAGIIGNAEEFDAALFGFTAREAEIMDPQHRVFLECAWEAFENAGYDPRRYPGWVGVYAGAGVNRYALQVASRPELIDRVGSFQAVIGNDKDYLTTQLSYRLNLRGPSIGVQTACSTSLVAIHLACQGLIAGECDMALAGGVSIHVPEGRGYMYQKDGIGSPDGHCRPFDSQAAGTVPSSGVGVIVLRRLADALGDGDRVVAVIKGSAVNNDGANKVGYTAPSIGGQVEVIAAAQAVAEVDADTIQYIEAHGTGTSLGDPIEVAALAHVFAARTQRRGFCGLGSVKSNIGHLDAAAGVAGLIKVALSLENRELPPTLHYKRSNRKINFGETAFYVNHELMNWPQGTGPRRAGVSSFGIGGTNAHVIVEEAPKLAPTIPRREWQVLTLSAQNEAALKMGAVALEEHARSHPAECFADVAYTLQVGRQEMGKRRAVLAITPVQAADRLRQETGRCVTALQKPAVAFVFPGQGTQRAGMGAQLYRSEPSFRETVDACCEIVTPWMDIDLRDLLLASREQQEEAADSELHQTRYAQPALFVFEYALAQLWMSWGVRPSAFLGHSVGEYVAACLAGVMPLSGALSIVAQRGQMMQSLPAGAMLAVAISRQDLLPRLGGLDLAAVNAPELCVVSGREADVAALERELAAEDRPSWRLRTSHAFHSEMMAPILEKFREVVAQVQLQPPRIPLVSNVTGTWIDNQAMTEPEYWVRQLRQTVEFDSGLSYLVQEPDRILLEVGPGRTLSQLARQQRIGGMRVLPGLSGDRDGTEQILGTLGRLWELGVSIDWTAFHSGERLHRVALPGYAFQRQRYSLLPAPGQEDRVPDSRGRQDSMYWFYVPSWKQGVAPTSWNAASHRSERRCLLFTDGSDAAMALDESLGADGWDVIRVEAGEGWKASGPNWFALNPEEAEGYTRLWRELSLSGTPSRIIHLWNLPSTDGAHGTVPMARSFYSLLYLARAIGSTTYDGATTSVFVFSTGLHGIDSSDVIEPDKSLLLGACRVLSQEYPQTRWQSIDLSLGSVSRPDSASLRLWLAEMESEREDSVVAYRGSHRWVASWDRENLNLPSSEAAVHSHGVYLITGGLGGLGLELARYLTNRVKARLVLLSRSTIPDREQWEKWIDDHGPSDRISRRLRQLQALEGQGAELLIVCGDVADAERMKDLRAAIQQRFGSVDGIFHLAGVAGGGLAQLRTKEQIKSVFAPKIDGTRILAKVFPEVELLVLFSSLTAVLGGVGQVDYSAANGFLDAYAQAAEGSGKRVISINWDAWQEVGMAAESAGLETRVGARSDLLQNAIHPEESWAVLDRILAQGPTQVAVSTYSLSNRTHTAAQVKLSSAIASTSTNLAQARPENAPPYIVPASRAEEVLATFWTELLGFSPVGRDDDFFHLGGHSLTALQLTSRIREQFKVDLPLESLFSNSTPARLASQLSAFSSGEAARLMSGAICLNPSETSGDATPFFCVHPAGGTVYCYRALAQSLGTDHPIYSFESPGVSLSEQFESDLSIESMAGLYIRSLQAVQPAGPYQLGGWSMGGIIAYEMAQRLERMGHTVKTLVLFDTSADTHPVDDSSLDDDASAFFAMYGEELSLSLGQLKRLSFDDQLKYVLDSARRLDRIPENFGTENARRLFQVYKRNRIAQRNYTPSAYSGAMTLFQVQQSIGRHGHGLGWIGLVLGGVEVYTVPGTHNTILSAEEVIHVAQKMRPILSSSTMSLQVGAQRSMLVERDHKEREINF